MAIVNKIFSKEFEMEGGQERPHLGLAWGYIFERELTESLAKRRLPVD